MTNFRPIFENDWCGIETFLKDVLSPVFGDYEQGYDVLTNEPEVREKAKNANITEIRHAATFDFFGSELKVFDITVGDNKKLENNKVGIQAIVRQYINQFEGALIIFHHQKVENQEWRFSYVEKRVNAQDSTSAKRYTYILGKHLPARTISDRFTYLEDHKDILTLKDLTDAFSVEVLTKQFYDELFNWYEWACENVTFPIGDTTKDKNGKYNVKQTKEKNELNLIRLITRLMFVWFIKQKDLIPSWVFDESELNKVLTEFKPESKKDGNYYNAVLQNLFFATLNKKIEDRAFADDKSISKNKQFGVKNFYRDNKEKTFFKESNSQIIERFKTVPFLNGGLFECLDKLVDDKDNKKNIEVFTDGFSREPNWMAFIPNNLFWQKEDGEHEGVIHLLSRYNFTVEENSPSDVQVALDPELLGKVFENLLGTYNPETSETARKDSGSFYTPREIVSFMVDESIKNYLSKTIKNLTSENIQILFNDNVECYNSDNKVEIVNALKSMKILDPACGSGAFPMGALQRIVHLIQKCNGVTSDKNSLYSLKLDLIEKCLYGVDIQPIAVQICKLRFFISLICEQDKTDSISDNYGFNPLPNLETKFVVANSLIGMERKSQNDLFSDPDGKIEKKKLEIQEKRHEHFKAPTAEAKAKCREDDRKLRAELANLLEQNKMFAPKDAEQLAEWNPYDQNAVSPFFDAEWMFNTAEGFDIVIGNPPILRGRDIKRYSYEYADLYLIATFPSKHYDIEEYPAVKEYLLAFGMERLEQTGKEYKKNGEKIKARKKTNNKWFETQDSISYWDDFNKPKIVWARLMRLSKSDLNAFPRFCSVPEGFYVVDSLCFFSGSDIEILVQELNSEFASYYFFNSVATLDNGGFQMRQQYVEEIPLPRLKTIKGSVDEEIYKAFNFTEEEIQFIKISISNKKKEIESLIK